jgi:RNA polymerase sigma factor (sigma-70 family)
MMNQQSDEHLLDQFVTGTREEADSAFARLMARHGPLVMAICRQVLRHQQDAEDAFQTTFLGLARRAATIQDGRVLGSWLRAVAYRNALRLSARAARRRWLPALAGATPPSEGAESHAVRNELRMVVRSELDRLPEEYRALVVHCHLEGKTNEEVARLKGFPVGTVKGRLWRARGMLRERLQRRGFLAQEPLSRAHG